MKNENELIAELGYRVLRNGDILGIRGYKIKTVIRSGYEQLNITISGRTKSILVHRLVAREFIPNIDCKPEVNHIDGNKLNNDFKNLEWVTRSENIKHGIKNDLIKKSMVGRIGKKHWRSKPVLRYDMFGDLIDTFESTGEASRQTGFNVKSIQDACVGKLKTYKNFTWIYGKYIHQMV